MKKVFTILFFLGISASSHSQTVGLFYNNPGALDGYILFAPGASDTTYLIDKCGKRIHQWVSAHHPGLAVYLLSDGTLLRCALSNNNQFQGGGQGGIIEKYDWNSNLLWTYQISDLNQCQHHDAIQLPNGNIVALAWENHTGADAHNNGRTDVGDNMWSEKIVEIQPIGADSGTVVWQWHAWDHLIQDVDNAKPNYGVIADHPELLNINLGELNNFIPDWLHFNGLDYDSVHDQLLVSSRLMSEVYIIDHSTTLAEASSHAGGNAGHGGDFLYRWGNPQNYGRGTVDDQKLYEQHNPSWIPQGCPGAGSIMVFNNGIFRPGNDYSTVDVFTPPQIVNYNYPLEPDSTYKPAAQDWIYTADPPTDLFSQVQGGAQRLPNGNTLICEGTAGVFTEVDSLSHNVWKYVNPVSAFGIISQGGNVSQNSCFRVTYLPADYPGLNGQVLVPGAPIELNPLNYNCVSNSTGVQDITFDSEHLMAYSNPFHNSFAIHVPLELSNATLQVRDVTGRLLFEEKDFSAAADDDAVISLQQYTGVMFLSVKDKAGSVNWNATVIGF